jgi:flagellar biosynthetic protein FlhB
MAEDKSSKTEKPTSRRRQEARRKGMVPKSMEINSVAVLMAGVFVLYFTAGHFYHQLSSLMVGMLSGTGDILRTKQDLSLLALDKARLMLLLLFPVLLAIFCVGLLSNLLQVGLFFSSETITPKLSRLDPVQGLSRLFSARALMELFKSLAKIVIVALVAYLTIRGQMKEIAGLSLLTPKEIGTYALKGAFVLFLKVLWVMVVLSIVDYVFQRWQSERDLKMSKDELREEHKQTEGDPHVKARIRSLQREMARKRMMSDVPNADVVVTNPEHLAVALKYEPGEKEAPVVVAKGRGLIAEKIKAVAAAHDVPVVENKPLAQSLYRSVEIGRMIPVEFYQAVADVLAYVYQLKGKVVHG